MAVLDGFAALGTRDLAPGRRQENRSSTRHAVLSQSVLRLSSLRKGVGKPNALEARRHADRWLGLEDFNYPYSHRILELTGSRPDLVLCHNLHGGYFDLRALSDLAHRVPVLLRLFDSWLFTGHCANTLGCLRWQTGCGRCPDLNIPPAIRRDVTRFNWWRKRRSLNDARLFVSAESQWILDRAKQSLLAPAVAEWKLIPGGVDLDTFSPGSQADARQELGLDPQGHIVLFVANRGPENPIKDFPTVRQAMLELGRRNPDKRLDLLAVGSGGCDKSIAPGIVVRRLGYIRSPDRLASLYRAADVYVARRLGGDLRAERGRGARLRHPGGHCISRRRSRVRPA